MDTETTRDPVLDELIAGLRAGNLDFSGSPQEARASFEALLDTLPVAEDLAFADDDLGGVPALRCTPPGSRADKALLYLHGGAYIAGSAKGYRGLAAELGRTAGTTSYMADYRLAPEHPFPAAVNDCVTAYGTLLQRGFAPEDIIIAGDSAGGGLAVATLIALRDSDQPLPAAAVLISPWADLACAGRSVTTKAADDPSLDAKGLLAAAEHYLQGEDAGTPLASPIHADLSGLPPLLIQVGSAEILLDDAVRLAAAAGQADVSVNLDIWPHMVHVWHGFAFMLEAGRNAIEDAGQFMKGMLGED